MAKQINQYTKTRTSTTSKDDDLIDWDSTEDLGTTFESAKMTRVELLRMINDNVESFYNVSASLPSDRQVTMNGFNATFRDGNVINKAFITLNNIGFLLQDISGVEKGSLGYDTTLDTASLELKNTAGTYLKAFDGQVGIGTASPTAKLHIDGSLRIDTATPSAIGEVWTATDVLGNGEWAAAGGGSDGNGIFDAANDDATLSSNFGFRVADTLTVKSTTGLDLVSFNSSQGLFVGDTTGSSSNLIVDTNNAAPLWIKRQGADMLKVTYNGSNPTLRMYSSGVQRVNINAESFAGDTYFNHLGNTGFGLNNPTAKLHVKTSTSAGSNNAFLVQNNLLGGTDLLTVKDNGNVGINETVSLTTLNVRAAAGDNKILILKDSAGVTKLQLNTTGFFSLDSVASSKIGLGTNSAFGTSLKIDGNAVAIDSLSSGTPTFRVRQTGNTSIGGAYTGTAVLQIKEGTTAGASVNIKSGVRPTTPFAGDIIFDGTNFEGYNGSAWVILG